MPALILALAASASLSAADTRNTTASKPATPATDMRAVPDASPKGLTSPSASPTAAKDETFCGNGEILVIYDEDADGNPIPGTEVYGCVDD